MTLGTLSLFQVCVLEDLFTRVTFCFVFIFLWHHNLLLRWSCLFSVPAFNLLSVSDLFWSLGVCGYVHVAYHFWFVCRFLRRRMRWWSKSLTGFWRPHPTSATNLTSTSSITNLCLLARPWKWSYSECNTSAKSKLSSCKSCQLLYAY